MEQLHLWRVYNVESGHAFQTLATPDKAQQFRIDGYEIEDLGPTDRNIQDELEALTARLRHESPRLHPLAETMRRSYAAMRNWAKAIAKNRKRLKDQSTPPISEDDIIDTMRDLDHFDDL